MKIFVTYSTPSYFKARNFAGKMAKMFGKFDKVVLYSPDDIDVDFKQKHKEILTTKRGAGLWLWKPYSIYKALVEEANDGDYVFYCDAATFFVRNSDHIIKTIDNTDIWVSDNQFYEEQYTKEDVFHLMGCTEDIYRKTNQIQAQFFCARRSAKSIRFVKEWLELASDIDFIGPNNTKLGKKNCEAFIEHRFDQSLLSVLAKKNRIRPHLSPLIINYPSKYKPLFYRNGEPVLEGEYPCCLVLQHSATIDYRKSIVKTIKAWVPRQFGEFLIKVSCLFRR